MTVGLHWTGRSTAAHGFFAHREEATSVKPAPTAQRMNDEADYIIHQAQDIKSLVRPGELSENALYCVQQRLRLIQNRVTHITELMRQVPPLDNPYLRTTGDT